MPTTPQDHKKKGETVAAAKQLQQDPTSVPGWDLMKDFAEVPVWDQTPMIETLRRAFEDSGRLSTEEYENLSDEDKKAYDEGAEIKSFDINLIGDLARQMIPHAKDQAEYTKFVSGHGAMERAANLAMAWVGQMGEFNSSENS